MSGTKRLSAVAQWMWSGLTQPRPASFGRIEAILLGIYTAVVALGSAHHEPWFDEAQGWLIAKDNGLYDILVHRLHHEGAPGLWQVVLYPFAHAGLSFVAMHWIAAAFGVAGAYVVLRYAPLPPFLRWLLPFSFWLQYQFAVVARPYVMFPSLAFLAAHLYGLRARRHIAFALVAGLAANVNLHTAAWACGVMLVYVWTSWSRREEAAANDASRLVLASLLFCCMAAASAAVAWPAANNTGVLPRFSKSSYVATPVDADVAAAPVSVRGPVQTEAAATPAATNRASLYCSGVVGKVVCGLPAVRAVGRFAVGAVGADFFAVANSALLASLFVLLLAAWLYTRRSLRLLLPLFFVNVVFVAVWVFDHHSGLAWIAFVAATWMALERAAPRPGIRWLQPTFFAVFGLVLALQIGWSASAAIHDIRESYDAGADAAKFLETEYAGKRVMAFSTAAVPLQLYGDSNRFAGWETRYWPYTVGRDPDLLAPRLAEMHPDAVVVGRSTAGPNFLMNYFRPVLPVGEEYGDADAYLKAGSWTLARSFCGEHFTHGGVSLRTCYEVYRPASR